MVEYFIFPLLASSALLWQTRPRSESKKQKDMINKLFRKLPLNVEEKSGKVKVLKCPKLVAEKEYEWGNQYRYSLPVGVSYRHVSERLDIGMVIEDTINRDVEVNFKEGLLVLDIYKKRLPTFIPFTDSMLQTVKDNSYKVVIGVDHRSLVYHDFKIIPHMVIGGMTRYGKTVVMKLLITQLALTTQSVKFHLFDLKSGLAFNRFKKLPQVHSVSRDVDESLSNLKNLRNAIIKRQKYFEKQGYEDIGEAHAAGELFGRDLVIVDEASVLAPQSKSDQKGMEIHKILEFIAQVAGGLGFNLIMCSQYPTGDILPRQVKQNADAKLSFRLSTDIASKVILDETGAQDIVYGLRGRAIYKTDLKRMIQVPMITNEQIDTYLEPLRVEKEEVEDVVINERREDIIHFG